jgi:hypothetical protein
MEGRGGLGGGALGKEVLTYLPFLRLYPCETVGIQLEME